ncbi:hypothetical protein G3O08_16910 [Cryomorpha ignava]|uniref:SPOR domain-containing protein n=1 Tax=Cryomorpha ignava TaxID=101383 RepID=A0A7K3WUK4_9FLAO|nr:hypothetical protein [Cryomorpha ignava]NEN25184.1 hypothetical protein [Cryomorpha ignava]
MIKTLLFGLNVFGFLLIGFFQKSEVIITHTPPEKLKPGQEAVVTVEIDKSTVSGFAKYQITLGDGLTAEMVESAGASFTFNDQKAKFIWMALPDAKKFTIKYRIIADKTALGNLSLDSRFSYIYENERKNYDLPDHKIAVGEASALAANQIKSSIQDKASNKSATIVSDRQITSVGINQWKVDLTIQKSGLQGFAKIEENIPNGYTVIDLKSSSAVFSLDDTKVKYIWYDIPENETVTVSYKMLPVIAMDATTPKIDGYFSYLKDEETITIPIGETTPEIAQDEEILAANPDTSSAIITDAKSIDNEEDIADITVPAINENPKSEDIPKTEKSTAVDKKPEPKPEPKPKAEETPKPETKQPASQNATADNSTNKGRTDANIVNVPEPETGVYYRVQIAAGKNNLKTDLFAKLYNFSEGYKLENMDGLFKYTTGYHQVYKAARDGRVRITAKYDKFKGPFVTAYNDGERITVQEALMITSQKWFQ